VAHTVISANVTRFALSSYVNGAKRQLLVGSRLGVVVLNHSVLQGDVNLINFAF
jgi:hypothetical protein